MRVPSPEMTQKVVKPLLFVLCLLPAVWLLWQAFSDNLGANPLEALLHGTGDWALRLLLLTLCVTPLRRLSGWHGLLKLRRLLGLSAFFYALAHVSLWLVFEHFFDWQAIFADILKRPYISVGLGAMLFMLPLALTSNQYMLKRLGGRRWQEVHQLVYLVAIAAVIHFWWKMKLDISEPFLYAVWLSVLLAVRYPPLAMRLYPSR